LLKLFWDNHDPTTLNRQGPDIGDQYRSIIFVHSIEQKQAAQASKDTLIRSKVFPRPIVTVIEEAGPFYRAEEYHQQYFEKKGVAPTCHR
jgi:peptide-methionine (S)-S-oxide reductase